MKHKTFWCFIMVIVIFSLVSCKEAPVSSKSTSNDTVINEGEITDSLDRVISWEEELVFKDIQVFINAEVSNKREKMSLDSKILSVEPQNYSVDQVKNILNLYFPGCTFYDATESVLTATKSDIEDKILSAKANLKSDETLTMSEEARSSYVEAQEAYIKELEKAYQEAPDLVDKPLLDLQQRELAAGVAIEVRNEADSPVGGVFISGSTNGEGIYSDISIYGDFLGQDSSLRNDTADNYFSLCSLDLLEQLGMSGFDVDYIRTIDDFDGTFTDVFLTKAYYDIPETYIDPSMISGYSIFQEVYDAYWNQEYVQLRFSKDKCISFRWIAPTQISTETDKIINLIPFSEVQQKFKEQLKRQEIWINPEGNIISRKLFVTKVKFGVMKVKQMDGSYEMLPVWDFFGHSVDKYNEVEPGGYALDENMEHKTDEICLLTINALDGKVINRALGY